MERYTVLKSLLEFSESVDRLRSLLGSITWDFDGVPLRMNRDHVRTILARYVDGDLSSQDVEDWANFMELV